MNNVWVLWTATYMACLYSTDMAVAQQKANLLVSFTNVDKSATFTSQLRANLGSFNFDIGAAFDKHAVSNLTNASFNMSLSSTFPLSSTAMIDLGLRGTHIDYINSNSIISTATVFADINWENGTAQNGLTLNIEKDIFDNSALSFHAISLTYNWLQKKRWGSLTSSSFVKRRWSVNNTETDIDFGANLGANIVLNKKTSLNLVVNWSDSIADFEIQKAHKRLETKVTTLRAQLNYRPKSGFFPKLIVTPFIEKQFLKPSKGAAFSNFQAGINLTFPIQ